jgi:hypothetical protein
MALAAMSPTAVAVPLAPGDTVFPDVLVGDPGTLLDSVLVPFTAATYDGEVRAAVYENAGGTLDFYYQVSNLGGGVGQIARVTNFLFSGFDTEVFFRTDGGSVGAGFVDGTKPPATADRNILGPGDVVGFSFNPPDTGKVAPGETSNVLVVRTNATDFELGTTSVINGGTVDVETFQPVTAAIPEPLSVFLIGGTLVGLASLRRFRRG